MNKNKIAVITGASRLNGIGASICHALADDGFDIFFTYWTNYDLEMPWGVEANEPIKLKDELKSKGVKVASLEIDLTKEDAPYELFQRVISELGNPSVLVNNAAYSTNNDYTNLTPQELYKHYAVNIQATTLLSIVFAQNFKFTYGGRIVNMTSGQFKGPMPGELAYATTKGAIDALTITLASEVAKLGITVNAVNPGPTNTGWMTDQIEEQLLPSFPFGRIGEPRDVAKLIKFLVSEGGDWITGQILHSEGGFMR